MLAQLEEKYPEDVRVVYRHFPLSTHDKSSLASQAAEAAGLQGKFWEMHDLLFAQQGAWGGMEPEAFQTWLVEQASGLGLDAARFGQDLASTPIVQKVKAAQDEANRLNLPGTPFILVNGSIWQGPVDLNNLSNLVQLVKMGAHQFTSCPEMEIDPDRQYTATLKTEKGDIVIQLYAKQAPLAVNSFIFLAKNDWYDGVTFHRVVSTPDLAQAGDPSGSGWGGPGYAFRDEITPELNFDKPGVVGMANGGPNTNGSQFFIIRSAIPQLDGKYTVFGQVIKGLEVLNELTPRNPNQLGDLPPGDRILDVIIAES